jgi:hypothetical protein
MNTHQRAQINRANAQHSTGPRTDAGKQKSSLNALRHGLTGQIVVIPGEDLAAYQQHLKSFTDDLQPVGAIESNLVQALADCSWRMNRVAAFENNVQAQAVPSGDDPISGGISVGAALESMSKTLSNLSLHTQRLSRQFERTVNQLRELQKIRADQEATDLDQFLDITEMYDAKQEPYDPTTDGFVFSEQQINHAILRRNRERESDKALEYWDTAACAM